MPPGMKAGAGGRKVRQKEPKRESAIHGTFHLFAVLLAFIMGNLFAVHSENQKDLRSQLAVLHALDWELGRVAGRIGEFSRTKKPPCAIPWQAAPVETKVWQDVSTRDSVLLLREVPVRPPGTIVTQATRASKSMSLLDELRLTYTELDVAPQKTGSMNETECAQFMADLRTKIRNLDIHLNDAIDRFQAQYDGGQWVFSQPLWIYVAVGFGVLWMTWLVRGLLVGL